MRGSGVVAWADTDASGWIHHTAAFRWVEEVEHAFVRSVGVDPGRFPRRTVSATYDRPLRAGDPYEVDLRVASLGRTSITWEWTILTGDTAAIEGRHTAIHVGEEGRPAPLPDALRAALEGES